MSNELFLNDFFKHAFGMHDVANQVARLRHSNQTFPPYNIIVDDNVHPTKYQLEMAVAGFSRDQISVKLRKENGTNLLVVEGNKTADVDATPILYLVNGLAARSFRREFTMSDAVKVDGVSLVDGILTIRLSTQDIPQLETILQIA
jgi:molecular chaperone IbpA